MKDPKPDRFRIISSLIDYAQKLQGHFTLMHLAPMRWRPHVPACLPHSLGGGHPRIPRGSATHHSCRHSQRLALASCAMANILFSISKQ